jgi:NAD(P)-dependent dehydrogenase (short-subunit alcohol dehydrogenase family)
MTQTPLVQPPVAMVTGASRGLGAAIAEALGAVGWQVVAVARTVGGLEELDDRIRRSGNRDGALLAPMDITQPEAMRHLCRSIHDRWGGLDLWVHAAIHAAPLTPAAMIDEKDWRRSSDVNIEATRRLIAFAAPLLAARKGSRALFFDDPRAGQPFFGSYGATKAAQIAMARSWQAEQRRLGPEVLIETPAPMPTATRARFFPGENRGALTDPRSEASRLLVAIGAASLSANG